MASMYIVYIKVSKNSWPRWYHYNTQQKLPFRALSNLVKSKTIHVVFPTPYIPFKPPAENLHNVHFPFNLIQYSACVICLPCLPITEEHIRNLDRRCISYTPPVDKVPQISFNPANLSSILSTQYGLIQTLCYWGLQPPVGDHSRPID